MTPKVLFRFFDNEKYAENFLDGRIRISTLEYCREMERSKGGDDLEGNLTVQLDSFIVNSNDPESERVLQNLDMIRIENSYNTTIKNASHTRVLDAHVLCFTKTVSPYIKRVFGRYGVVIYDPILLFTKISKVLRDYDIFYQGEVLGHVTYDGHNFSALDDNPIKRIGFSKRGEIFGEEKEFRMLFFSRIKVKPEFIEIGSIRGFARRMTISEDQK